MSTKITLRFLITFCLICYSCRKKSIPPKAENNISDNLKRLQLKQSNLPFEAYVKYSGVRFRESGNTHLSYEMNVYNSFDRPIKLTSVSIHDLSNAARVIQEYDSIYFDSYFERPGKDIELGNHQLLPSEFGVVYINLSFPDSLSVPKRLFHRIKVEVELGEESVNTGVETAIIDIPEVTQTVLAPPFRNGKWMYVSTHHRDTRAIFEGEVHIVQRHCSRYKR
jgi:hypothetical protein